MIRSTINILLAVGAVLTASGSQPDFSKGVFIVNEDWYGHRNSSVNYFDPASEELWQYRVVRAQNEGMTLGCTNQYGQIYGGRFYLIAKQAKDAGDPIMGGRITVCDASTMKIVCQKELIDPSGKQCDGRAYLGVDEHKGYISTSNGVWVFDTDRLEVTGMVQGTANPNDDDGKPATNPTGSLYKGQCGTMARVNDRVFVAHQQFGLLVIDPATDITVDTITMQPVYDLLPDPTSGVKKMPGIGSVVLSKDGNLWLSVAKNVNGDGTPLPYIMRVDPATLESEVIELPADISAPSTSWYAWTPDGFCASTVNNALYWNGGSSAWFAQSAIFKYDIDNNRFSKIIDFDQEASEQGLSGSQKWKLYGCSMRLHPVDDEIYLSLFHDFQNQAYRLRRSDADGVTIGEYDMISDYWFPSLPVFPDNYTPEAHDPGVVSLGGEGPWTISLDGVFTDYDSMESAIVKTVTDVSDPETIEARIVNGNLYVATKKTVERGTFTVTVKANSNGEIVSLPIQLRIDKSGIDNIVMDRGCRATWNGHALHVSSDTATRAVIYSAEGFVVSQFDICQGENDYTVDLNNGVYIVRIDKQAIRILVR